MQQFQCGDGKEAEAAHNRVRDQLCQNVNTQTDNAKASEQCKRAAALRSKKVQYSTRQETKTNHRQQVTIIK
jgi:hypothetical protein